jgi:hypothetical protein
MRFIGPDELRALQVSDLDAIRNSRELVAAYGDGEIRGIAAASLLFSDYAVMRTSATLVVDSPDAWAAAAWRLGRTVVGWALRGAVAADIVDETTTTDAEVWREEWTRHRSVMALDSAAFLIRSHGGDSLERAEFARLFAAGEPQQGLSAFLTKTKPSWKRAE